MTFGRTKLVASFVVAATIFAVADRASADGKPTIVVTPGAPQPVMIPSPEFIPKPPAPSQGAPPSRIEPLPPLVIYTTPLVVVPVPPHGGGQGARK
jgi:hypothetical protein